MKAIVLTCSQIDGAKLYASLVAFDSGFEGLPCLTKDDIERNSYELSDCEYIFSTWYMPEFSVSEIKHYFPALKCVFYAAGTVKYFAEPFLKSGVKVFSAAVANGIPVAEFAVAQIILAGKGYFQAQRHYRWPGTRIGFSKSRSYAEHKTGNYKACVGIVGCGAIGSKVVELLKPYKISILVYDPYLPSQKIKELGVEKVGIEELFCRADVISNHLPDIPETKQLINGRLFNLMKPNATFINTGRGAQVDEKALNKVLSKNKYMCALLDVTSHEPLFPWSPLFWRKNVFLTPHIAGSISNEYKRMVEYIVKAYHDELAGIPNICEVSLASISKQSVH